jgi:hypothetical protein
VIIALISVMSAISGRMTNAQKKLNGMLVLLLKELQETLMSSFGMFWFGGFIFCSSVPCRNDVNPKDFSQSVSGTGSDS